MLTHGEFVRWSAAAGVLAVACASDPAPPGFRATDAGASDVSLTDGARDAPLGDAGVDWPDADPFPDAGPGPGPSFDAGPAPVTPPVSCAGRPGIAGRHVLTMPVDGRTRRAIVYVPGAYDGTNGNMLVLNFHGFSSADWQQELLTRMNGASERYNFITVYPQGVLSSWNAGDCCGTAWNDSVDDISFVHALLDRLEADYCIDPKRVYATGMSNGGFMSHRLACAMPQRIAAIAPVAGVLGIPPETCAPGRAVPVLHFHGTGDAVVPYEGGTPILPNLPINIKFRSVVESLEHWRTNNGCTSSSFATYQNGDVECVEFPDCRDGAETVHCRVDGGGHTWPGGVPIPAGKTTTHIDATDVMVKFFLQHPLP